MCQTFVKGAVSSAASYPARKVLAILRDHTSLAMSMAGNEVFTQEEVYRRVRETLNRMCNGNIRLVSEANGQLLLHHL